MLTFVLSVMYRVMAETELRVYVEGLHVTLESTLGLVTTYIGPVCRTPVTRDPVPSLSLKNQVERCLSPRDLTAYMTRKADVCTERVRGACMTIPTKASAPFQVEKESLRMKRREVKVTSTLAVLHVEKRRIACVFGAWTDANVRLLNKGAFHSAHPLRPSPRV